MKTYFAELDSNKVVKRVIVADLAFINSGAVGNPANWVETVDGKGFAGIGHIYDSVENLFKPPKPFNSWIFDKVEHRWKAPKAKPGDGHVWDETIKDWVPGRR